MDVPGGPQRWLRVSATPVQDAGPDAPMDGIVEDVTASRSAEEALRKAHSALEAQAEALSSSNADLQRFAHVISHDLQEPLRMVATFTDVLDRRYSDRLDAEAHEFLRYAREGAERMQGMIHGLLDFCLLEKTPGQSRDTDCTGILDKVLANLMVAVEESGAAISRDPLPVVRGDELLLTSVFQNLVANGLKFRREGTPPRIHVGAVRGAGEWTFSVRDNGIGIDPAEQDRLFMVFRRLSGSERFPGSGVGLAICKRVVERHGGRIWWEPGDGGGSDFRFTLPADGSVMNPVATPGRKERKR